MRKQKENSKKRFRLKRKISVSIIFFIFKYLT